MFNDEILYETCDLECIGCRIDAACALLTEHADMASAITLVGVPNCGETFALVQRAHRVWPVEIVLHTQPSQPLFVALEIRGWPVPEFAPVRPLPFPRTLADCARSWLHTALRHADGNLGRVAR